jgi:hypothetical protein
VPVFDLAIRRDLAAVDEVAAWVLSHHSESAAAAAGSDR